MVLTQKIGQVKFYVNDYNKTINSELRKLIYSEFEKLFKSKYENAEYKKAMYFDCTYSENGSFIISLDISMLYLGVYQTLLNYNYLYPFLLKIVEEVKNHIITVKGFFTLIAVMSFDIIPINKIKPTIEKSEAYILKENNNGKFSLFQNEDEVIKNVSEKIKTNFHFLNCHRETKFHEIDPKVMEARLCLVYGLNNTSITTICIALEETLKTILKYDYIKKNQPKDTEPSLTEIKEQSNKAQKEYGSKSLGECIIEAHRNGIITDEEKKQLKSININLRNAQIHSDKSKMFSSDKTEVTFLKIESDKIEKVESELMSAKDIIYIQGYLQFHLAEKYAKDIFNEIEDLIFSLCKKFWDKNKELINTVNAI